MKVSLLSLLGTAAASVSFTEMMAREAVTDGASLKSSGDKYFTQRLNHFNGKEFNQTYQQRYYEREYGDGQGPLFLYIGGEGTLTNRCFSGMFDMVSQAYGASSYCLEHRFYGESFPEGKFLETDDLQHLSAQQALADMANFIISKKAYPEQKVIVFGCSYPGSLAAWARARYPGLITGAVSSSSPIEARREFVEFDQVIVESLTDSQCQEDIMTVTHAVEEALSCPKRYQEVARRLACDKAASLNHHDAERSVLHVLAETFIYPVQYNYPPSRNYTAQMCTDIRRMVKDANGDRDALVGVAAYFIESVGLSMGGTTCDEQNMMLMTSKIVTEKSKAAYRAWNYQCCSEMGFWQMPSDEKSELEIARSRKVQIDFYDDVCARTFPTGAYPPAETPSADLEHPWDSDAVAKEFNNQLGGYSYYLNEAFGASNIHFTNGDADPWKALSVLPEHLEGRSGLAARNITAHIVPGGSHCTDFRVPNNEHVRRAQEEIKLRVGGFLGQQPKQVDILSIRM